MISSAILQTSSCPFEMARKRIWLMDSKGIVSSARTDKLARHKQPYAHTVTSNLSDNSLLAAVQLIKPTAIIGTVRIRVGSINLLTTI